MLKMGEGANLVVERKNNGKLSFSHKVKSLFQRKLESSGGEGGGWILGSRLQAEAFRLKPENDEGYKNNKGESFKLPL
jgi:hypothetical protein